ncbi:MAG: hypothetical protein JXB07_07700 [Anaerolineae bacterium]|nr:hypothetical protein [Anaerolineae bacterium]
MLGLPWKSKKSVASIEREHEQDFAHHRRANNGRGGLRMTMVGPHMVLVPLPQYDRIVDDSTPIPTPE